MKPQYVFSFLAVAASVGLSWRPGPPRPVNSTRQEDGFEVQILKHAEPHRFEELVVPSLQSPDPSAFQLPRSYIRNRLCAGDEVMLAEVQGRLLLTPGEGGTFGELVGACAPDASFCGRAAAAFEEDAGLGVAEFSFFAEGLRMCDASRFASLRSDLRLPLEVRSLAWASLPDAGAWSPALGAAIDEHLSTNAAEPERLSGWRLASALAVTRGDDPGLLDASVRLMNGNQTFMRILRRAASPAVRVLACERLGCDAGVNDAPDAGIELKEELAACALQRADDRFCLDRLARLDWSMARAVAQRVESDSNWQAALLAFETHEAFAEFARSISAAPLEDGGFTPERLLGELGRKNMVTLYTRDGLGHDELAARWAAQAPELEGTFFFESWANGGPTLTGRRGDETFTLTVRSERETLDVRAVLALLNSMLAERGHERRFFLLKSKRMRTVRLAEPARVSSLVERRLIVLDDPDEARRR